jgi:hypothetical protein
MDWNSQLTAISQLKTQKDGVTTRKFARFNLIDLAGSGQINRYNNISTSYVN